jgi:hypothetical protein
MDFSNTLATATAECLDYDDDKDNDESTSHFRNMTPNEFADFVFFSHISDWDMCDYTERLRVELKRRQDAGDNNDESTSHFRNMTPNDDICVEMECLRVGLECFRKETKRRQKLGIFFCQ